MKKLILARAALAAAVVASSGAWAVDRYLLG
jgi:hypothetical protein